MSCVIASREADKLRKTPGSLTIYTIGHSTLTAAAFLALLKAHGIRKLADVRRFPHSRRHPHFDGQALETLLRSAGITYCHFPALGGMRRPREDSVNTAWKHPSFRGYADHMQTAEFKEGLRSLEAFAGVERTTVMCAEAVWWRCHRRLLADALLVRGVEVLHILSAAPTKPHELSEFGCLQEDEVIYPGLL